MDQFTGYDAAIKSWAYYLIPDSGYLQIGGDDRIDFLQRQTTNDLRLLEPERAVLTVLTTPNARILDVLVLLGSDDDSYYVITLPGRNESTISFLKGRIFFNDNVTVDDLSDEYAQVMVTGAQASTVFADLGFEDVGLNGVFTGVIDDISVQAFAQDIFNYLVIVNHSEVELLLEKLNIAGGSQLNDQAYDALRIEAGFPGPSMELTEEYTPLEVGLQDSAISFDKGCYTGQEVIARQVNFDKITRKLVGLRLDMQTQIGETVHVDGKKAGTVTSVTQSPRFGDIALAVLKRPFHEVGTKVKVGDVNAQVVELPF